MTPEKFLELLSNDTVSDSAVADAYCDLLSGDTSDSVLDELLLATVEQRPEVWISFYADMLEVHQGCGALDKGDLAYMAGVDPSASMTEIAGALYQKWVAERGPQFN